MRTLLAVLLATTVVGLSSCANVPADYKFDATKQEGVIVGSITYDGSLGEYSVFLAVPPTTTAPKIKAGFSMWPPLGPLYDDGLKARGELFAVAVPAGRYAIADWQVRQGYKISRSTAPIRITFNVEAGKAVYLGNMHFSEEFDVSLRDRSERDLPLLRARYSFLNGAPLAFTIAEGTNLEHIGGAKDSSFQLPPSIFVPAKR